MIGRKRGIPGYSENAVLKLIVASGVGFVSYGLIWAILTVAEVPQEVFTKYFTENITMPAVTAYPAKFWTIATYGWVHSGFWVLFSNMVWLYVFGSLVQMLIGHRQLIPMFIYCMLVGGIFYQLSMLLPGNYFSGRVYMMGAQASVVGMAVAALTLAPDYKFYLTDTFRIPLVVIAIIFFALQLVHANINVEGAPLFLLVGGALMGYLYVWLLRNGIQPAGWYYKISDGVQRQFEPNERLAAEHRNVKRGLVQSLYTPKPQKGITQDKIDEILDKINSKGYDSLSKDEKELLRKASEEK
ncbi:MAG: rhomboid family intramembrane serine protease [Chitinophagales bacterium]|nr:rhomboid family intramembrane serine protease [Chitinophagaceae bacterium]MCB9063838.1 rhomboid family intramembrane serine protease [Chitinophagales bacterium]